jgi:hypothetical protein
MKVQKPIIHGRDHLPGGADPIPSLFGAGSYQELILQQPSLVGYWPMDDASGDATDLSGHGYDLSPLGTPVYLQPGKVDGGNSIGFQGVDEPTGTFNPTDTSFAGAYGPLNCAGGDMTVMYWIQALAYPVSFGGVTFFGTPAAPSHFSQLRSDGQIFWSVGATVQLQSGATIQPGVWTHVTCVRSADELLIYFDGDVVAAGPTDSIASTSTPFRLGCAISITGAVGYFNGLLDEVAVFKAALDASTIALLAATEGVAPGDVLTNDGHGGTSWQPPSVEVSGGGVNPAPVDETPVDSSEPAASGPTTSTGWHLNGHFETVVLHDPNPGRFDVPTMKWTRVPFTSITIYRTWEPTIDAAVLKTARLKDDRGLMQAAKNGVLHINPDMAWPGAPPMNVWIDDAIVSHPEHHLVEGWFPIEYPVLDARYLPENDVELLTLGPTPDAPRPGVSVLVQDGYQRAARFLNLSTGSVLRFHAGSADRAFGNWWFPGTADDSTGSGDGPGTGNLDNPFPIWGDWPARPIHMTPPYPQLNPTDSRAYYQDYQGMAGIGFGPYRGVTAGTNLSAGANLCMQAWQDTPWLLRFSTGRFPAYRGFDQDYNGFPHLAVTYHYDPDTIDHTTGRLLLPAT